MERQRETQFFCAISKQMNHNKEPEHLSKWCLRKKKKKTCIESNSSSFSNLEAITDARNTNNGNWEVSQ